MPVTFSIAAQPASVVHHSIVDSITWTPAVYVDQLLKVPIPQQVDDLISSSILDADLSNIIVRNNGLIDTVLLAWGQHHNLVIRPDDLWIAILTQLNFYVNKHAEEMRHYFVAHEEKQKLIVKSSMDTFTANWGDLAQKMTSQIEDTLVDPSLTTWILPNFTTTTHTDTSVAAMIMMATFQEYFVYEFHFLCGIPQVTLLGEKSDYEILLSKVKHLDIFSASSHPELDSWRRLLVPIIRRLIDSFDDSTRDIDGFWAHIVHSYDGMCGESFLSGWIGAFGIFDEEGSWSGLPTEGYLDSLRNPNSRFTLDGTEYPMLDATKLPRSWASVPILVNDHGWIYEGKMVAGLVGSRIQVGSEGGHEDTVSPYPAWFMLHSNTTETPAGYNNGCPYEEAEDWDEEEEDWYRIGGTTDV